MKFLNRHVILKWQSINLVIIQINLMNVRNITTTFFLKKIFFKKLTPKYLEFRTKYKYVLKVDISMSKSSMFARSGETLRSRDCKVQHEIDTNRWFLFVILNKKNLKLRFKNGFI